METEIGAVLTTAPYKGAGLRIFGDVAVALVVPAPCGQMLLPRFSFIGHTVSSRHAMG